MATLQPLNSYISATLAGNSYFDCTNNTQLSFGGCVPYTLEAWIKPAKVSGTNTIISRFNGGVAAEYGLWIQDGCIQSYRNVGPWTVNSTTKLNIDEWYHIATSYDGATLSIYINGLLDCSGPMTNTQPGFPSLATTIGTRSGHNIPTDFFVGELYEVRVWKLCRSASDILAHMNAVEPSANGLVADYTFSCIQANDASYKSFPLNPQNGPGFVLDYSVNNTLAFIKTANTPNGHVEVHLASAISGYMTRVLEVATNFGNESDGVWQLLPNQDLAFIKTSNTPNGHVEVHIASRASNYASRILETATTFGNESDGVWQLLPNQDLAFIKTSNTPNGHVEVHIASRASNYASRILETATTFANESDGVWQLLPNMDLAFIKTSNTPNGHVEVHIASRSSNYDSRILETATTFANESDGLWQLLPNLDLAFIKTSNTPNGHVEVHIASRASNYQARIIETPTTFGNESDGVWSLLTP